MAALFTRMVGICPAASRSCSRASMEALLPTSRTAPRPLYSCDARPIEKLAAPSALVDVPTTVAPAPAMAIAIALPIPREAPVTSATCFSSMRNSCAAAPPGSARGIGRSRILQRQEFHPGPLLDTPIERCQGLAGPALSHLRELRREGPRRRATPQPGP